MSSKPSAVPADGFFIAAKYFLLPAILAAGIFLRFHYLDRDVSDPSRRSPDEAMYTAYASVTAHEGPAGAALSVAEYNRNPKYWGYPPPTRIGYLYPLALAMKLSGRYDLGVGLFFSLAVSVVSLLFLAAAAYRFFGLWTALGASFFMAFSAMELAFVRKVWQDGLLALVAGILFFLGLWIVQSPRKFLSYLGFGGIGAYCLLIKESGAVFFGLWAAGVFYGLWRQNRSKEAVWLLAVFVASTAGGFLLLAGASGGPAVLAQVYKNFTASFAQNEYVAHYQGGPWYALAEGLWLLSPAAALFCLAGLFGVFGNKRAESRGAAFIFLAFAAALSVFPYLKNLRFLSPVYFPYYLLSAMGLAAAGRAILRFGKRPLAAGIFLAALAVMAWAETARFEGLFVQGRVKDLVNPLIKEAEEQPHA